MSVLTRSESTAHASGNTRTSAEPEKSSTVNRANSFPDFLLVWRLIAVITDRVRTDIPVLIKGGYGRRDQDNEKPTFIVDEVTPLAERRTNGAVIVSLRLESSVGLSPAVMGDIRAVAEGHPGTAPLEVSWNDGRGSSSRFRSRTLTMAADGAALTELRALLGHERVRLVRGN